MTKDKLSDIFLTTAKFPDIFKFSMKVVTLCLDVDVAHTEDNMYL